MRPVKLLGEFGYEQAVYGFSLSFNTSIERAKELLPKYAFGTPGENKFLRVIHIWLDVDFPRLIWPESDQYKVASVTLSESTVHTLSKRLLTIDDFELGTDQRAIDLINEKILLFQQKKIGMVELKANLPEGLFQTRMWQFNYATLQNIVLQRTNHKVKIWDIFIKDVLSQIEHPEFIVKDYVK